MKAKKKLRLLIALISLFYLVSTIQSTYAKYTSAAQANTNISVARWNILINNQDIKNNSDFSNTITPTFAGTTNIASNIIAPTSEGYFDVVVNGNNTDVKFQYTITLTVPTTSNVSDLKIFKYTIDEDTTEHTFTDTYTLTNTVNLADTNKTHTYRFYVKWLDGDGETMDNTADTNATNNGKGIIDISVNVIQLAN
jgi:hypothetical protein